MNRSKQVYVGIDLGAASSCMVAGLWDGRKPVLEESFRFANGRVYLDDTMRWNVLKFWIKIQNGLAVGRPRQ